MVSDWMVPLCRFPRFQRSGFAPSQAKEQSSTGLNVSVFSRSGSSHRSSGEECSCIPPSVIIGSMVHTAFLSSGRKNSAASCRMPPQSGRPRSWPAGLAQSSGRGPERSAAAFLCAGYQLRLYHGSHLFSEFSCPNTIVPSPRPKRNMAESSSFSGTAFERPDFFWRGDAMGCRTVPITGKTATGREVQSGSPTALASAASAKPAR